MQTLKTNSSVIVWVSIIILIITLSLIDTKNIMSLSWPQQDKYIHIAVFAMFMLITKILFRQFSILKISIITFSLGLLIEIMQKLFTHGIRHFHISDIYSNIIGIALGIVLIILIKKK